MYLKRNPVLSCVLLLALTCWIAACARATPTPMPAQPEAGPVPTAAPTVPLLKTYSSAAFGFSLEYPGHWLQKADNEARYEGIDGFFEVSAFSGDGLTIDEIAWILGYEKIDPYIMPPGIEDLQIQGQEARLLTVYANDTLTGAFGQAWLIVELPEPIQTGEQRHDYLQLWADEEHIGDIAGSITFP